MFVILLLAFKQEVTSAQNRDLEAHVTRLTEQHTTLLRDHEVSLSAQKKLTEERDSVREEVVARNAEIAQLTRELELSHQV